MEHVAAILLIIGCGDTTVECRELPAPAPAYETIQECQQELTTSVSYYVTKVPQVVAECIVLDPAEEESEGQLVWDVTPDGDLVASLETDRVLARVMDN